MLKFASEAFVFYLFEYLSRNWKVLELKPSEWTRKISSSYILDKSVDNPINFLAIFFSNAVGRLNGSNLKKQRWIK